MIEIELNKDSDGHKDLVVKWDGEIIEICDSYYLAIDKSFKPGIESYYKVKELVTWLVDHWIEQVSKAVIKKVIFLPIDLSDQYIGCFKLTIEEELVSISYGYSKSKTGHSISLYDNPVLYLDEEEFIVTDFVGSQLKSEFNILLN